jgi:ketosteroid isomerase-like protein
MDGGKPVESEVATFFRIVDGRIAESFEMTRPLSGIEADRDVHTAR